MPIQFKKTTASFSGICSVDEAEALLSWALSHPAGKADLGACEHLHCALLQVLLATRLKISRFPAAPLLAGLFAAHQRGEVS